MPKFGRAQDLSRFFLASPCAEDRHASRMSAQICGSYTKKPAQALAEERPNAGGDVRLMPSVGHHVRMTLDWAPVAAAVRAARESMHLGQDDLADLAGVSRNTITNLEGGHSYSRIPRTIVQVGRVFGWPDPMADAARIIAGHPAPPLQPRAESPAAPAQASEGNGMPLRLERQLRDGRVVESTIVEIDGLKLVVVLMSDQEQEVSDRQIANGLAAWSDLERRSRNLSTTDGDHADT